MGNSGLDMGRSIIFIFLGIIISVDLCASDCSCSDYLTKEGYGQCLRGSGKLGGELFCYVNEPSNCGDLVKSGNGKLYSAEACKIQLKQELGVEPIQGTDGYVEYYPGNMNLIVSAPHGGDLKPTSFGPRVENGWTSKWGGVNLKQDMRTKEIAMGIVINYESITGRRPHLIVNNLHRSHMDPNRDERIGTQYIEQSLRAYREYHDFITQARMAAAPPQLRISSTGPSSTAQPRRMGDYYLSNKRYNNFPVYVKVNDSQHVYVNSRANWVVGKLDGYASLLNKERASTSPPRDGWKYYLCENSKCRWEKDPALLVESIAAPYVTMSSGDPAGSRLLAMMGNYRLTGGTDNDYPVYQKADGSMIMHVNEDNQWVVFHDTIGKLRNTAGLTTVPPRHGWQFWDVETQRWIDDSKLRVDPPFGLLLDIHGQAHKKNATEIGYALSGDQLNDNNCENCKAEDTNIWSLIQRTGETLHQMLYGDKSLGFLFNDAGYKAVPSPDQQKPEDIDLPKYFNGGFTVTTHGSSEGGSVDAIQMELPGELTTPHTPPSPTRQQFILDLVDIIQQFYLQFYDNQDVQSS